MGHPGFLCGLGGGILRDLCGEELLKMKTRAYRKGCGENPP
jgi:hypothetical protein